MQEEFIQFLTNLFSKSTSVAAYAHSLAQLTLGILVILIALGSHFFIRKVLIQFIHQFTKKSTTKFDDILFEKRVFHKVAIITPIYIVIAGIHAIFPIGSEYADAIERVLNTVLLIFVTRALLGILNAVQKYLQKSELFKDKPIGSYVQLVKIIVIIFAAILALSILIGKSPLYFITGLGAFTAILLLVFKDTILGLVASVQMSADDLVRVGDWITMDKYKADGDVVHISLNTVKVQNFDKTITSIPAYAFISDSFTNWRGMQTHGARRIKRTINISPASVHFVSEEEIKALKKVAYLKDFIEKRLKEIEQFNATHELNTSDHPVNGRRFTNIGLFRNYLMQYLQHHQQIDETQTLMVRQLASSMEGIPMEIYCFTKTTVWEEYEGIQSDLFDHIFAATKFFDLEIQEALGSNDLRHLSSVLGSKNIHFNS